MGGWDEREWGVGTVHLRQPEGRYLPVYYKESAVVQTQSRERHYCSTFWVVQLGAVVSRFGLRQEFHTLWRYVPRCLNSTLAIVGGY